jgi:mono/diheme cytochrome c family protein
MKALRAGSWPTAALIGLAVTAHPSLHVAAGSRTLAAPIVFTDAQASRGESLYLEECGACHGSTLRGVGEFGGPGLIGERFLANWRGKPLAALFERTQTTMPQDSPGRLSAQEYADIIAFILKANDYPAGAKELTSGPDLKEMVIVSPPP